MFHLDSSPRAVLTGAVRLLNGGEHVLTIVCTFPARGLNVAIKKTCGTERSSLPMRNKLPKGGFQTSQMTPITGASMLSPLLHQATLFSR